jgi:hypothetical protein
MPPSSTSVATWDDHPPRRGLGYLIDASLDSLSISCRSLRPSTPPGHSSSLAKDPGRVIEFRQFRIERFFRPQRLISTNQFLRTYPSRRISLLATLRIVPLGRPIARKLPSIQTEFPGWDSAASRGSCGTSEAASGIARDLFASLPPLCL